MHDRLKIDPFFRGVSPCAHRADDHRFHPSSGQQRRVHPRSVPDPNWRSIEHSTNRLFHRSDDGGSRIDLERIARKKCLNSGRELVVLVVEPVENVPYLTLDLFGGLTRNRSTLYLEFAGRGVRAEPAASLEQRGVQRRRPDQRMP